MDATMLARSIVSGVVSVPMDFYLGLKRTFQDLDLSDGGRRIQSRNMHDDVRVGRAVYNAFKTETKLRKSLRSSSMIRCSTCLNPHCVRFMTN